MKKQTIANNDFLRKTKQIWNGKIFKKAAKILNQEGEAKAREYVQTFTTKPLTY